MDYTPYYETMRRTSLLRGMTDAELDTLMACFAPRVRRYAKGELLLMAGYETHEVGLVLEGAITASKPLADGSTVVMARMGPGGVFADVLAGGRSRSPVNISAAEACLALYLPCEALLRPCAALHSAHLKLLQNWLETISDKYFALDRRLELICCRSLRGMVPLVGFKSTCVTYERHERIAGESHYPCPKCWRWRLTASQACPSNPSDSSQASACLWRSSALSACCGPSSRLRLA